MNICHIITTLDFGGAERQLVHLTKEQVSRGYHVNVIYLKGSGPLASELKSAGVNILSNFSGKPFWLQVLLLRKLSKRSLHIDIFHAHLPRSELLAYLALSSRTRYVVSRHNSEPFWPGASPLISIFSSRIVTRKAKAIVAISSTVKNYLATSYELGADEVLKTEVIPYGSPPVDGFASTHIKVSGHHLVLGTISRLVPQKDLETLLIAIAELKRHNKHISLKIVGVGILEDQLKSVSKSLGIAENVEWLGNQSSPWASLFDIDLFIMTSLYEGFGLVFLEAMKEKCPIIASSSLAAIEVLGEEHPGLFDIGDAHQLAKRILEHQNYDVRLKNVITGLARLNKYQIVNSFRAHHSLYLAIINHE